MSKGIKCRSLLKSKVIKASYGNKYFFDSNENSFKIQMEKIKHGVLTKQLMYSFKSKVDHFAFLSTCTLISPHANRRRTFQFLMEECDTPMEECDSCM